MEIRYNPDTVEEILDQIKELEECVSDMKSNLNNIKDSIVDSGSGEAISKIEEAMDQKIERFAKVEEDLDTFHEYISDYIEGLKEIDEISLVSTDYHIDGREVIHYIKEITKAVEGNNYNKFSRTFENEIEDFYTKKRKYNNIESNINVEKEYEDDEAAKHYIYKRQDEIDEQIKNQWNNENVMEEIQEKLKEFKD